jgi:organic radical activating enzyme
MAARDYYCSMKFKYLKIDLESKTTYNCHAAKPYPVDFTWLKENTGQLFNTPINVAERQQMLVNQRNSGCEQNCWAAEDVGAQSPRLFQGGDLKTHSTVQTTPEIIDLTIGPNCNLTCSYCCKEYSTSWRRDVVMHGDYHVDSERYQPTDKDRVLLKISQSELKNTKHYQELLNEIKLAAPTLKKLTVTGGEPFLDNQLLDMLAQLNLNKGAQIEIYTGLGVNSSRFAKIVSQLEKIPNVMLRISAENTKKFLEFNRYGLIWENFVERIDFLESKQINFEFHSTLSNLTILDFVNFYKQFNHKNIIVTFAYQPLMHAPYVLDLETKTNLREEIKLLPMNMQESILQSIANDPTESQRLNLRQFLSEFVRRRPDISLNIFPKSMLNWVELNYVV